MDYEKIRETVPAWEQQLYINANYELRRIESLEKLPDSEYIEMLDNIRVNGDDVQREQFLNDYISISEYEEIKNKNESVINEINEKYGIPSDRRMEETRVKALRLRPQLEILKKYYERQGSYIMRTVDVSALSDEEVIREYDRVTYGIDYETLQKMLNAEIKSRITDKGSDTTGTEAAIDKFKSDCEEIKQQLDEIKRSLILDDVVDLTDAIRGLTSELSELSRASDDLIRLIDDTKILNENDVFSMTPAEIKSTIKGFKDRLKEIKQHQIDKYNARVDATNRLLEELRNKEGLDVEIPDNISRCDASVTDWKNIKYLDQIDYNKLVEVNKLIAEINEKEIEPGKEDPEVVADLDSDINYIENEIDRIESEMEFELTDKLINDLNNDIDRIVVRREDFLTKLENNKDKISEERYNSYSERLNDAEIELAGLYTRLNSNKKNDVEDEKENNDYKELKEKLEKLKDEAEYRYNTIEALYGHLLQPAIAILEDQLNTLEGRLDEIKAEVDEKYGQVKIDQNQYEELIKKIDEIEEILKNARERVNEPEIIKDVDIFAFLNRKIDGVEMALDELEKQVDALEKPIKDRNVRKQIDAITKALEKEIKSIEETLEKYKGEDPEKYKETKERLDAVKERLNKVSKEYRKKCPLLVRAVKSAKAFYKKHKKACLVVAGLAAFSLVGYHVLIPAIMHGNIMIAATTPALRGFTVFINSILGNVIGATKGIHGAWTLANGVMINPAVASTSLLKGLAISGIGTTALVAPLVVAVKKLVEKMKLSELKEKLKISELKEKLKPKEKKPVVKDKTKKADKMSIDEISKLLKEYRKFGKSLDEFCEEYELTEDQRKIIEILESNSEKNKEILANSNSGRKGR